MSSTSDPFVPMPNGDAFRASQIVGVMVRYPEDAEPEWEREGVKPGLVVQVRFGVRTDRQAYAMHDVNAAVFARDEILARCP